MHISFLMGVLILLYWQSFAYWAHIWRTDLNYNAGCLMPFLSFYMIWNKRVSLVSTPIVPAKSGIIVIIFGISLYVAGLAAYTKTAQQVSFFIVIPGIILLYFGFHILRRLFIPFLILIFMIPYAEPFYPHLEVIVSQASREILFLLNVPVYLERNFLQLPNITAQIVGGCTGIRYMTAALPIGVTIAYLYMDSRWKKVLMVLFSVLLAIMVNLFRVTSILFVASKGNTIILLGKGHKIYGYLLFLVILFGLFAFANRLMRFRAKPSTKQKPMMTGQNPINHYWTKGFASYANLVLIALVVMIPTLVHARLLNQPITPLVQSLESFPYVLGGWKGRAPEKHLWHPKITGATNELFRLYEDFHGNVIQIFVSYLPIQSQGRELVYVGNLLIPPGFRVIGNGSKTWTITNNPSSLELNTEIIELRNGMRQQTLLLWYQNTNHYLSNKYMAKAFLALDSLVKNRSHGAVFVLTYKSSSHQSKDDEIRIQNFLNNFIHEIGKYVPS